MSYGIFLGLTCVDMVYYQDDFPQENHKSRTTDFVCRIGGPAANAAVTYAKLGGKAKLYTCIGKSTMGAWLKAELAKCNVEVIDFAQDCEQNPCISTIIVNEETGTRTIFSGQTNYAAHLHATDETSIPGSVITSAVKAELAGALFLCTDGNLYEPAGEIVTQAWKMGKHIIMDGGSYKEHTDVFLDAATELIASEVFLPPQYEDITYLIVPHNIGYFAITHGDKPTEWWDYYEVGHHSHGFITPPQVKAVDTLGAGDVLHGAYCYYRMNEQESIEHALEKATKIASESVTHRGI
ncbi:MAG: hypothetical protein E7269_00775 [Lachnospiraceae bacterium]|nr:hypothetical protein [Lachnospiraceae bacterium]